MGGIRIRLLSGMLQSELAGQLTDTGRIMGGGTWTSRNEITKETNREESNRGRPK